MTYSQGGLIQLSDINNHLTNVGNIYGVGTGDRGYGQTSISLSALVGTPVVTGSTWLNLRNAINACATHQGTATTNNPATTEFDTDDLIKAYPPNSFDLGSMITSIDTNRLNFSAGQMSTTTNHATSTRGTAWSATVTHEFTVTFSSEDHARHFFNSGGAIITRASRSGGAGSTQNSSWTTLLTNMGNVIFGYTSTTQSGTGGTGTSLGYYDLTATYQVLFTQSSSGAYAANNYKLWGRRESFVGTRGGNGSVLRFQAVFDDAHTNAFFDSVDGTLSSNVDMRKATVSLTIANPTYSTTIGL
jgi:hypothetical protein